MVAKAMGNLEPCLEYKQVPRSFAGQVSEPGLVVPILQGFLSLHKIMESLKLFVLHMGLKNIIKNIYKALIFIWKDQWL